ncbi:MAG: HIT domain-containing protein, partial [Chloroflexi bacterium]|nr:HIT domain-containing protein [Chloroflexota bacterium]
MSDETSGYDRDNVFARILRDEIPSDRVHEDEEFIAFRDINPAAPTHIVLIPRGEPPAGPGGRQAGDARWAGGVVVAAAPRAAHEGGAGGGDRGGR